MNRKKKVWLWVFAGCLLLGAIIWLYPFPSNEKIEFSSYEQPLFYEGKRSEFHGVMKDERLYIPIEYVRQALNKPVVYDRNSDSMIATTVENVYQITIGKPFYKKNDRLIDITYRAVLETEENRWIAAEFLQTIYALSIKTYPNGAVHTFSQGFEKKIAKVKADVEEYKLAVRSEPTVTSSYYTSLQGLDKVTVLMEKQDFYLIVTPSGYTGYVPKSSLQIKGTSTVQTQKEREKREVPGEVTHPIHLAWDGIYTERANPEELPNRPGITVLSPTWFTLVNDKGEIHSRASASYVQSAHSNGDQVWALFSNGFDPELTSKVLPAYQKRTKMVHQLLRFAEKYNLDGINLDFENVYQEDGKWFTQFVRELTPRAHNQGLVISVDVTFISDSSQWSEFYERAELVEAADYLIVMAYDQH
ncbi:glycosyl hydrolase family 18 protein [Halobacillus ihumii]|uniref:glycosyl hydrolase family 18 protein n=1 Tax=Halobacillus ihumii TaxID=2686092 RepID=UPI0013D61D1F|nr:glycosyl hydrolase family 18 protein [Halobacillus ihumii]